MITGKLLTKIFKEYMSDLFGGQGFAASDLKFKGFYAKTVVFPMPLPVDSPNYVNFLEQNQLSTPVSAVFQKAEIDLVTKFYSSTYTYKSSVIYRGEKKFVSEFTLTGEVWSRQALEYHFRETFRQFEDAGLIKLTPQQEADKEYKEAKKEAMAKAYGAEQFGKFDMGLLKKEIENLKNSKPSTPKVMQDANGGLYLANPDAGSSILHKIMETAAKTKSDEAHVNNSTFSQLKNMAEKYYDEHGAFPEPDSFIGIGLNVVIDSNIPQNTVIFHTAQPPMHQVPKPGYFEKIDSQNAEDYLPEYLKVPKPVPVKHNQGQSYDNAGNELAKVIPALSFKGVPCPEAAYCQWNPKDAHATLSNLIIHLNDQHRWPRSATDPNPRNKPNIADWIDEVCLTHGLDQSFHPKEQTKEDPWAVNNKIQGASLDYSMVDEPVVIDEAWLDKYEYMLKKGYTWTAKNNTSSHGVIGGSFKQIAPQFEVTEEQASKMIKKFKNKYPKLGEFFDDGA